MSRIEKPSRLAIVLVLSGALLAAVAVGLSLGLSNSNKTVAPGFRGKPLPNCAATGCAVVNTVRTTPRVTVFYGASCSGVGGRWFLNVVEEGPNDSLRPAYSLRWSFSDKSPVAAPNGTVTVSSSSGSTVSMTLLQGILTMKGSGAGHTEVSGIGSLTVKLGGTASAPTLTIVESGLQQAEQTLGLLSPFDVNGQAVTVPVEQKQRFARC